MAEYTYYQKRAAMQPVNVIKIVNNMYNRVREFNHGLYDDDDGISRYLVSGEGHVLRHAFAVGTTVVGALALDRGITMGGAIVTGGSAILTLSMYAGAHYEKKMN